uniref:Uncharacterized protein n=1 Tax=Anguilla anguilla TaxID=7936 RepID=A0A0E9UZR3_ANGAN
MNPKLLLECLHFSAH